MRLYHSLLCRQFAVSLHAAASSRDMDRVAQLLVSAGHGQARACLQTACRSTCVVPRTTRCSCLLRCQNTDAPCAACLQIVPMLHNLISLPMILDAALMQSLLRSSPQPSDERINLFAAQVDRSAERYRQQPGHQQEAWEAIPVSMLPRLASDSSFGQLVGPAGQQQGVPSVQGLHEAVSAAAAMHQHPPSSTVPPAAGPASEALAAAGQNTAELSRLSGQQVLSVHPLLQLPPIPLLQPAGAQGKPAVGTVRRRDQGQASGNPAARKQAACEPATMEPRCRRQLSMNQDGPSGDPAWQQRQQQ